MLSESGASGFTSKDDPAAAWSAQIGASLMTGLTWFAVLLLPLEAFIRGPTDPRTLAFVTLLLVSVGFLVATRLTAKPRLVASVVHVAFTIGAGWILPPGYPNFSTTNLEMVGTKGALLVDDTHRDTILNTMDNGIQFPISSMPGESVGHVFAGPMANETHHFIEAVALDKPVLVTPAQARKVMEVYIAADLSADRNEPVSLPLNDADLSSLPA